MKRQLKRFVGASFTIVALTWLLTVFVLYPNNLFAKRMTYKTFEIYSNSQIEWDCRDILNKALTLAKSSELSDNDYRYDIFLIHETTYKTVTFKLMGPTLARTKIALQR